jgi:small subunit ribosomal protein S24e
MEIVVEKERENPLLRRKEIYFRLKYDAATPSRRVVREKLAGLFNANSDVVVIEYMRPEFGKSEASCYARIYEDVEDLKSIEEDHILKRNFAKKESEESKESEKSEE